jgi:hypothetical protein
VNHFSAFRRLAFTDSLDWKLKPVIWKSFDKSTAASAEVQYLFFTKKLGLSDILGINPYPLKEKRDWHKNQERLRRIVPVYTLYKPKSKKVQPVDIGDEKGEKPGGREDWYERAKLRETPQEQEGKYKDHLIPRFCDIPRGSRLTPERVKKLDVGEEITPEERDLFEEMLLNREKAIAFDWKECGKVHEDVTPPIVIKTVPHKAWQAAGFAFPKALREKMMEMLRDRLDKGVLERCFGPYRNPWFLVSKKTPGQYRLVNACMEMNRYTIRDANLPPSVDEFSEEFAGCQVSSLIDWFSGYDQLVLAEESRDMTAFMTPLGLLRMTTVPQGATNSIAQFVRIVEKILEPLLNHVAMPFMDDVGVKGPYTDYDNEEVLPGIRRFIYEHIQNLDQTLERIERAGVSIGPKSQFMKKGMTIVGFSTGSFGRLPEVTKVIKIISWPSCTCVSDARAFIGVCVFYRIWVYHFALIAEPIYRLTKKGVAWEWNEEQEEAMNTLKTALTSPPALCRISYEEGAGEIVIGVDASLGGWGGTMGQRDENKKLRVARYESGVWNKAERNYDATKRETRAVLKVLRKLRFYIYGVHFILETDAKVLVAQMERSATDLPGSLVTRWIACIQMFDFEIRHIPGEKHTAADGLSRRPATEVEREEEAKEGDIDDWPDKLLFDRGPLEFGMSHVSSRRHIKGTDAHSNLTTPHQLTQLDVCPTGIDLDEAEGESDQPEEGENDISEDEGVLEAGYSEDSIRIATYLISLRRPPDIDKKEYRNFKRKALQYTVRNHQLWKRANKNLPMRLVVDDEAKKAEVLKAMHDDLGHKGRESTYGLISTRYFWDDLYKEVKIYVRQCEACQRRATDRVDEALTSTAPPGLFEKVHIDITEMPSDGGRKHLVIARCDFSWWPEARALGDKSSEGVAKFLWEDIICRHGLFGDLVVDGGSENMKDVIALLNKMGANRIRISPYNSRANGTIERGHRTILAALSKMTNGGLKHWRQYLHSVLLAERITTHRPTGIDPFSLVYGRECVLPAESKFPTWRVLEWDKVRDRADLIALRARQLEMRDADLAESLARKKRIREEGKEAFDNTHNIRREPLKKNDIVLRYDKVITDIDKSSQTKLQYRWLGPYRIHSANEVGSFKLEEMDGVVLSRSFTGSQLKLFIKKTQFFAPAAGNEAENDSDAGNANEAEHSTQRGQEPSIPRVTRSIQQARRIELEEREEAERRHAEGDQVPTIQTRNSIGMVIRAPVLTDAQRAQYVRFDDLSDD